MSELFIDIRKKVSEECKRATDLADMLITPKRMHGIIYELASNIKSRIEAIEAKCNIEKFDLCFIGKVGVGKSTAICYLTGLIDKNCFEAGNSFDKLPLLKTAAGRTTSCQTKIVPTEGRSRIVITKMSKEEFQGCVNDFCDMIVEPDNNYSFEIIRIICNMSGFPQLGNKLKTDEADIIEYLKKSNAESLAKTKENLAAVISKKINHGSRNLTEIVYESGNFANWLKDHMSKINDGVMEEVPIPREITVYVNKKDLELKIPEYISSIVDSRGLDNGIDRRIEEISDHMKKANTISVICDSIPSFGAEDKIHILLKHVLHGSGRDEFNKIFLLGLEKGKEIKKANGADDNYERGVEIKRNEALQMLEENGIPMGIGHISCYSALSGIRYDSEEIIIGVEEDVNRKSKEVFWDWLNTGLQNMYLVYYQEIEELIRNLKYLEQNQFPEKVIFKFNTCKTLLKDFKLEKQVPAFEKKIKDQMNACHHGIIRGCVNRDGSYDGFDLYTNSLLAGGEIFTRKCEIGKATLRQRINSTFDSEDEMDKICLSAVERELESKYTKYYKESCEHYKACIYECMGHNPIWYELKGYWGKGDGYKEKVINKIIGELGEQNISAKLAKRDFCKAFVEELGDILSDYQ